MPGQSLVAAVYGLFRKFIGLLYVPSGQVLFAQSAVSFAPEHINSHVIGFATYRLAAVADCLLISMHIRVYLGAKVISEGIVFISRQLSAGISQCLVIVLDRNVGLRPTQIDIS